MNKKVETDTKSVGTTRPPVPRREALALPYSSETSNAEAHADMYTRT